MDPVRLRGSVQLVDQGEEVPTRGCLIGSRRRNCPDPIGFRKLKNKTDPALIGVERMGRARWPKQRGLDNPRDGLDPNLEALAVFDSPRGFVNLRPLRVLGVLRTIELDAKLLISRMGISASAPDPSIGQEDRHGMVKPRDVAGGAKPPGSLSGVEELRLEDGVRVVLPGAPRDEDTAIQEERSTDVEPWEAHGRRIGPRVRRPVPPKDFHGVRCPAGEKLARGASEDHHADVVVRWLQGQQDGGPIDARAAPRSRDAPPSTPLEVEDEALRLPSHLEDFSRRHDMEAWLVGRMSIGL